MVSIDMSGEGVFLLIDVLVIQKHFLWNDCISKNSVFRELKKS